MRDCEGGSERERVGGREWEDGVGRVGGSENKERERRSEEREREGGVMRGRIHDVRAHQLDPVSLLIPLLWLLVGALHLHGLEGHWEVVTLCEVFCPLSNVGLQQG